MEAGKLHGHLLSNNDIRTAIPRRLTTSRACSPSIAPVRSFSTLFPRIRPCGAVQRLGTGLEGDYDSLHGMMEESPDDPVEYSAPEREVDTEIHLAVSAFQRHETPMRIQVAEWPLQIVDIDGTCGWMEGNPGGKGLPEHPEGDQEPCEHHFSIPFR